MIGYLGAFLGGLFALVSPCGALLVPAFFAYAFAGRAALAARTGVFYLGLLVALVPLGMGAAQASRIVFGHQQALGLTAGLLLIGFGVLQQAAVRKWRRRRSMVTPTEAVTTIAAIHHGPASQAPNAPRAPAASTAEPAQQAIMAAAIPIPAMTPPADRPRSVR